MTLHSCCIFDLANISTLLWAQFAYLTLMTHWPFTLVDLVVVMTLATHSTWCSRRLVVWPQVSQWPVMTVGVNLTDLFNLSVVLLQMLLMLLVFYLSTQPVFSFQPPDIVACLFCSTHKSLTLGECWAPHSPCFIGCHLPSKGHFITHLNPAMLLICRVCSTNQLQALMDVAPCFGVVSSLLWFQ